MTHVSNTKKRALVTGAAGFIGSNLTLALRERDWNVDAVDNLSTGRREFLNDIKTAGANVYVQDYGCDATQNLISSRGYDVVFHVGAIPRVVYSIENPAETEHNNVFKTLKLLEACPGNVGRVVFSSSSAVIGSTKVEFPSHEDYPRSPISPYGAQKSVVEDYMRIMHELHGLDTVSLRYFNVYGPRQYGDSPYSTVISAWCHAIKHNRPLRIDGGGVASRDFCYVSNVIDANLAAATKADALRGIALNIAHGETHTVAEVLAMFKERFGDDINVVNAPRRPGDVDKTHADITRARDVLGYAPNVNFRRGLELTWEWWGL